jgi:predicted acetyltransferase
VDPPDRAADGQTCGVRVELVRVAEDDKVVLARLLELYRYDVSEFRPYVLTAHGTFGYRHLDAYFGDQGCEAYFVTVDGELAGLAMSRLLDTDAREVAEFFVMRRYRRRGVGRTAAYQLLRMHPGTWSVSFDDANAAGGAFWPGVCRVVADGEPDRRRKPSGTVYPGEELRFTVT